MSNLQLDNYMPYHLVIATDLISRSIAKVYAQYDLTIPEWRILAQLQQHESLTPSELSQLAGMEKARISRALILMAKKQLIERTPDQADKRIVHVALNAAGKALFARVEPEVLHWDKQFKEKLGDDVYQTLLAALKDVQDRCSAGCHISP